MSLQLGTAITLPCGATLENRLVKASMAEDMSDRDQLPDGDAVQAYSQWADGGWGLVITGNVQVDTKYLGQPRDFAVSGVESDRLNLLARWRRWAEACQKDGTPTIVQLNHPGRQSPIMAGTKSLFTPNIAPSAVPLDMGSGILSKLIQNLVFGVPREMTVEEIETVVEQFANASKLAAESGFKGIEIHAAHGYLLAQFLSPKSNVRTDDYGGSAANRVRILLEVIRKIRSVTPPTFIIGVKLNSTDHQSTTGLNDCLEQITLINAEKIDFLEISGGSYEDPTMLQTATYATEKKPSTARREAFFLDFAHVIRARFPSLTLMLTGGFRSRTAMEDALATNASDLIGLARPAAASPRLPKELILNPHVTDADAKISLKPVGLPWLAKWVPIKGLAAGAETTYYATQIRRMGRGLAPLMPQ